MAQLALLDHNRVILEDLEHSEGEKRFYCFGSVSGGIMTVRFTYRKKYTDEPIGKVKLISDFLPSPKELALKDETVKVTISLSKASIDFFKKEAKKYNTQYQKMIRRLLDEYSAHQ